jgi:hypothetical protein
VGEKGCDGSEHWEDGVEEEVEDQREEELGGWLTESVRSQVREESSEEGSEGERVSDFEGVCHRREGSGRCCKI